MDKAENTKFFHSVFLDKEKCKGCTNCIKKCPTEAIRVRKGKAKIIAERCIDCAECVRVCQHRAKRTRYDSLEDIGRFKYKVALPAPSLYAQFNNLDDTNIVLNALKKIGFDDVFEVSAAAEMVSELTRQMINEGKITKPVISSACPAVVRLIRVRFPGLLDHLVPILSPVQVAAKLAREKAMKETGLPSEDIGICFISPCPAKVTDVRAPLGLEKSEVDLVLAIKKVYTVLLNHMEISDKDAEISHSGKIGISWASSGGESSALLNDIYLAADGIENVIKVLEDLEDEKFSGLEFIELNACHGGCVGGVLTVENPYIAKTKLKKLRKYMPVSISHAEEENKGKMLWESSVDYEPVLQLGGSMSENMAMMKKIEDFESTLPGLDCGACGSPSCKAFAEDVIRGFSSDDDCVFKYKKNNVFPKHFQDEEK